MREAARGVAGHLAQVALASLLACVPFWWLVTSPGWPANHETLRVFRRLAIFAGQWHVGHLLPIWSTTAFAGHGSPSPIIYNKLFNALSAVLWEGVGDPKLAVCASFVLLSLLAMAGMAAACRILLRRRDMAIETAAGVLVVFSTYATTDWLTRGAAAEYAAFALVPWLFAWCLRLLMDRVFAVWIGPLMALICLAHASVGLFCALPLGVCVASALCTGIGLGDVRSWARPFAISLGLCALILAPVAVAAAPYPRLVSFGLLAGITPIATHLDFSRLFWEPHWIWGAFTGYLTVEIDPLLLACGAWAAVVAGRGPRHRVVSCFLLGVVALVLALQTSQAFFVFRLLPGAAWLQFAFRLLVFAVVALALCGALLLDWLREHGGARAAWAALLPVCLLMSLGKPWLGHAPPAIFSDTDIARAWVDEGKAQEPWEYYPAPLDTRISMERLLADLEPPPGACVGRALDDMGVERASARFFVLCPAGGQAILPVTMAPGMSFENAGRPVAATRLCPDVHPRVPVSGESIITVRFPTFGGALAAAWRGETRTYCQ